MAKSNIENNDSDLLWRVNVDFTRNEQVVMGTIISKSGPEKRDDLADQELDDMKLSDADKSTDVFDHRAMAKEAIETLPLDAELWNRKGITCASAGRLKEAYECFEQALRINPNHQRAWVNRGNVLLKLQGKEKEALYCFEQAVRIRPNDPDAWFVKGVALARLEFMDEALAAYEHATELDARHAQAWYGMGLAARYLGYRKRAEECFKKSRKIEGK